MGGLGLGVGGCMIAKWRAGGGLELGDQGKNDQHHVQSSEVKREVWACSLTTK
jgi:hypothetical protein